MSYFLLPKINNNVNINPKHNETNEIYIPYVSNSLFNYYNEIFEQINKSFDFSLNNLTDLVKIVNPYEYIFSKVPSSKFSVSKLKPKTNLFYEFLEIFTTLNIFDSYKNNTINALHFTQNKNDTIECLELIRENYKYQNTYFDKINDDNIKSISDKKFDFLFFEAKTDNLDNYIISMIEIFMVILMNQESNGSCVIKIEQTFHKPIIDLLYFLSSLYDKTIILKPNTSNVTTFEKYIICKNFQTNENKIKQQKLNYFRFLIFLKKLDGKKILSFLDCEIPYYFLTKIDDMNIIMGQQQIESLDMIINIIKNKNREDKIETIKKTSIQKSVSWCEKYKIPHNKFSDKTNIFLPINKEIIDSESI